MATKITKIELPDIDKKPDNFENDVRVQAESSYMHPAIDSKKELIDWTLTNLGYPLITVELTDQQFNVIIADALTLYTKYASFPIKYIAVDLKFYKPGIGLDLRPWNVTYVREIATGRESLWGLGGNDIFFGFPAFMNGAMGGMPFFGHAVNGTNWSGGWITYHNFVEFAELSRRMTGTNPDFTFDKRTQHLQLYPAPRVDPRMLADKNRHLWMCVTAECEPPISEIYGEEYFRRIVLAKAKILLGTIRSKFGSVQLVGGGQINTEIGNEGKEELDKIIEQIRTDESFGNAFYLA